MLYLKSVTLTFYYKAFNEQKWICLNNFYKKFENAYLLADKSRKSLNVEIHSRGVMIHLPEQQIDSINNIVVLKY